MRIDLSGRAVLEVVGDETVERYIRRQFAPFPALGDTERDADVRIAPLGAALRPVELVGPAEDGLHTGTDGVSSFATWDRRRCTIPNVFRGETTFGYEPGFPIWRLLRSAIRPAIQLAPVVDGRAVAIHAASVTLDGGAIVVAGWAESGKTEAVLGLMERGASFLSDKWTFVGAADLEASPFPITIGIRRWVLEYLPRLEAATTGRSRVQFLAARAAGVVLGPVARRSGRTRSGAVLPDLARRAGALGDRAAYEIEELRAAYGQVDDPLRRAPVRLLAILRTVPGESVRVRPVDPGEAPARLARTAAYERRTYLHLLDRAAYASPGTGPSAMSAAVAADEAVLAGVCGRVPVRLVEAPFPVDPRRVADAILAEL
jgi:hypothetical protein